MPRGVTLTISPSSAQKKDKGDAFGQATQKAINTIQGWGKYERNANPYHPR
jgi:hypothetical protein